MFVKVYQCINIQWFISNTISGIVFDFICKGVII